MQGAPLSSPEALRAHLADLTTKIVIAAIERGSVQPTSVPGLVTNVFQALENATTQVAPKPAIAVPLKPAVPIKGSVTPDYIVCLENGKRFKSMRGHLRKLGMTPEQYREKWGLPSDYPIVAPNYAASRSTFALLNGLGTANSNKAKQTHTKYRRAAG